MTLFYLVFNILLISSLSYLIWQREPPSSIKKYLLPAFILKLTGGILLGIYYRYYFGGGDAQLFQNQSDYVTEFGRVSPASYLRLLLTREYASETLRTTMIYYWYSNSYFMVMLLSVLNFLTGNSFYLNSLYFSFFGFWGLWQLVKVLTLIYPQLSGAAIFSFLFLPSVVFWTSGISKETIYLGSLGWLIAVALRLGYGFSGRVWADLLALFLAGFLLWKIKFYFAALVFSLLLSYTLVIYLNRKARIIQITAFKWLLFGFLVIVAGFLVSKGNGVLNIDYFVAQLLQNNKVLAERSSGKPIVVIPDLKPNLISFIQNSPAAISHTFMRPFIWEGNHFFYRIAGLENLFLLLLSLLTLYRFFRNFPRHLNLGLLVVLLYVVIIAAILGLSTPNIGSLNRYRTAVLPFFVFLLLSFNYRLLFRSWFKR